MMFDSRKQHDRERVLNSEFVPFLKQISNESIDQFFPIEITVISELEHFRADLNEPSQIASQGSCDQFRCGSKYSRKHIGAITKKRVYVYIQFTLQILCVVKTFSSHKSVYTPNVRRGRTIQGNFRKIQFHRFDPKEICLYLSFFLLYEC